MIMLALELRETEAQPRDNPDLPRRCPQAPALAWGGPGVRSPSGKGLQLLPAPRGGAAGGSNRVLGARGGDGRGNSAVAPGSAFIYAGCGEARVCGKDLQISPLQYECLSSGPQPAPLLLAPRPPGCLQPPGGVAARRGAGIPGCRCHSAVQTALAVYQDPRLRLLSLLEKRPLEEIALNRPAIKKKKKKNSVALVLLCIPLRGGPSGPLGIQGVVRSGHRTNPLPLPSR